MSPNGSSGRVGAGKSGISVRRGKGRGSSEVMAGDERLGRGEGIHCRILRTLYMQRELQPRRARSLQRRVISAYVTSVCAVGERVRVTVCVIALRFRFVSLFTGVFSSPAVLPRFARVCVCVCALQVYAHASLDARANLRAHAPTHAHIPVSLENGSSSRYLNIY